LLTKLRKAVSPYLDKVALAAASLGLSPNQITALSFAVVLAASYFYLTKELILASALLLLSGFLDVLDGAVARLTGKASLRGGVLDSVIDRCSDALVLAVIALAGYCSLALGFYALAASFLVSYLRARGEAAGVKMEGVGFFERAERLLTLSIAGFFNYLWLGVLVVAILSTLTVLQRFHHLWTSLS